jgi:hypothetical protein
MRASVPGQCRKGRIKGADDGDVPLGRRALSAFFTLPLVSLVAGLVLFGAHADGKAVPNAAGAACTQHTLKYVVTDDPREVARQNVFERDDNAVTDTGFYTRAQPSTPTLHAASHGSVVVFYRPDVPAAELAPLHALMAAAIATKAPVIVTPRRQAAPLVALAGGQQLICTAADAAQTARVRTFAAGLYQSLEPDPAATTPPSRK